MPAGNLALADAFAKDYDQSVLTNHWIAPDVLFRLLEKKIAEGHRILDLGIGTGAGSLPFKNRGVTITGIDGSREMLTICRKKNIADVLILHDLENPALPFPTNSFDLVISSGVFHLIHPVEHVFSETARILAPGGLFGFTFDALQTGGDYQEIETGIGMKKTATGVLTYRHNAELIREILKCNGLLEIESSVFPAFSNRDLNTEFFFTCMVAVKNN